MAPGLLHRVHLQPLQCVGVELDNGVNVGVDNGVGVDTTTSNYLIIDGDRS